MPNTQVTLAIDGAVCAGHMPRVSISITELLRRRRAGSHPYAWAETEALERKLKSDAIRPVVREAIVRELALRGVLKPRRT